MSVDGAVSGAHTTDWLHVLQPHIWVSPGTARVGDPVTIGGADFGTQETVLVRIDGALVAQPRTGSTGSFSTRITVHLASGRHTVTVDGAVTGAHTIDWLQVL